MKRRICMSVLWCVVSAQPLLAMDQPVMGKQFVLKLKATNPTKATLTVLSKDPAITLGAGNGSADDPTIAGASLQIASNEFTPVYTLPAANWKYAGKAGKNKGYVYTDKSLAAGPVSSLQVTAGKQIKIAGKGAQLGLGLVFEPSPVDVILQLGSSSQRYCMSFGGKTTYKVKKTNAQYNATNAPAPAACPADGEPSISCGEFTPGVQPDPHGCTTKPARYCQNSSGSKQTTCPSGMTCEDVINLTASTCMDPTEMGSYGVGYRIATFITQSVVDPTQTRTLDTVIWYPTSDAGQNDPTYQGILNAAVDQTGEPYPLIMYSHGMCSYPPDATFLLTALVSRGFVVAAPPHNDQKWDPGCQTSGTGFVDITQERPNDIMAALNGVLGANQSGASFLNGVIDAAQVGMAGASLGGWTCYPTVAADGRFKAVLPMVPVMLVGRN